MNDEVLIHSSNIGDFPIRKDEMIRYMGQNKSEATKEIFDLVDDSFKVVEKNLMFKSCYRRFKIELRDNYEVDLGFRKVNSTGLFRNLQHCKEIYIFVATLGFGIDRQIKKYSNISPVKSLSFQGIGSGLIEDYCNYLNDYIRKIEEKKGNILKPRFSPGYGDLPLDLQKDIFKELDVTKKIGVVLNESLLMIPSKSVSAIIGITKGKI